MGSQLVQLCCRWRSQYLSNSHLLSYAYHFGIGALVPAGGFVGIELSSTCHILTLTGGKFSCLGSLMFLFLLSGLAPFLCKMLLLLLGVIGLAATLLKFKERCVTFPIKQL